MRLLLLFDHRFFRAKNGVIFSDKSYHYSFFKSRYLKVFDHVSILSRVSDVSFAENPTESTEGKGVTVIPLPDWVGATGYLRNRGVVMETTLARRVTIGRNYDSARGSWFSCLQRTASARLFSRT